MNELDLILEAWRAGAPGSVLATVVHVHGSAYRRPGARMLLLPDGRRLGAISGGCLERDVSQKAWWLTDNGKPAVRVYDSMSDDETVWEFGLGCNGVVQVLLERLESPDVWEAMEFISACRSQRRPAVVVTVIACPATPALRLGSRLLFDDNFTGGKLAATQYRDELCDHAYSALEQRASQTLELDGYRFFVEVFQPPLPMVVFGAGYDAVPLVAMAKALGWHVTVADGRRTYARKELFPLADRVVLTTADDPIRTVAICPDTVVVLMTHNYPQDRKLLEHLAPLAPRYLGILGPRDRAVRLLRQLELPLDPSTLHAPVGLDIGADTPETIAVSIIAEIQACLAGRTGQKLKLRSSPIHAREKDENSGTILEREPRACALWD